MKKMILLFCMIASVSYGGCLEMMAGQNTWQWNSMIRKLKPETIVEIEAMDGSTFEGITQKAEDEKDKRLYLKTKSGFVARLQEKEVLAVSGTKPSGSRVLAGALAGLGIAAATGIAIDAALCEVESCNKDGIVLFGAIGAGIGGLIAAVNDVELYENPNENCAPPAYFSAYPADETFLYSLRKVKEIGK